MSRRGFSVVAHALHAYREIYDPWPWELRSVLSSWEESSVLCRLGVHLIALPVFHCVNTLEQDRIPDRLPVSRGSGSRSCEPLQVEQAGPVRRQKA